MYIINDKNLIDDIENQFVAKIEEEKRKLGNLDFVYPLDEEARKGIKQLITEKDTIEYSQIGKLDKVWIDLINRAIKCLRFFDTREPFLNQTNKTPIAYGIDNLEKYHDRYSEFEGLLYGASSYYRDHVFHSIRTWLLGVFCLLKQMPGDAPLFIEQMTIDGGSSKEFSSKINFFEKISMWTLIALCHDLGYPLEKSQQILDKTQKMMKEFIPHPNIWNNFGFSGVQDNINEYIIKFMSTKMVRKKELNIKNKTIEEKEANDDITEDAIYLGRVQPKYYLKYTKSLERFNHGIISSVIIYKMLLYFLESDFNLNDDYEYKYEDARQFYIRREILRAMASHTCMDIYNIYLTTFSSVLFLCDELQEWGRKSWNDLYSGIQPNAVQLSIEKFTPDAVIVAETIDMKQIENEDVLIENIKRIYQRQYIHYKVIFRDGQYTQYREFNFIKKMSLILNVSGTEENKVQVEYALNAKEKNYFKINMQNSTYASPAFISKLKEKMSMKTEANDEIEIIE